MTQKGLVFNIQRYSIHDGPGIRTNVFLKGCPLRCIFCCNPESQSEIPELAHFEFRCQECGLCIQLCPHQAIKPLSGKLKKIDLNKCDFCGRCIEECPSGAWKLYGKMMTVNEVMDEVICDLPFYRKSGGGVTLTGGEPLMNSSFCLEILMASRKEGIHTAIETSGYGEWEKLKKMVPYLDLVLFDLKHMNSERHRYLTGKSNKMIHRNAQLLAESGTPIVIRLPLISGLNDSTENLLATGRFAKSLRVERIDILPFHQLGENKYKYLGKSYSLKGVTGLDYNTAILAQKLLHGFVSNVTIRGGE